MLKFLLHASFGLISILGASEITDIILSEEQIMHRSFIQLGEDESRAGIHIVEARPKALFSSSESVEWNADIAFEEKIPRNDISDIAEAEAKNNRKK